MFNILSILLINLIFLVCSLIYIDCPSNEFVCDIKLVNQFKKLFNREFAVLAIKSISFQHFKKMPRPQYYVI